MTENKKIIHVLVSISLLFLSLLAYLTYFEFFVKGDIINNSYNRRQWEREDNTIRGKIFDRNGTILADNIMSGENQIRSYPSGALYSHVIGYSSKNYGKSMLEAQYNDQLLGINELSPVIDLKNKFSNEKRQGNNLFLTIDNNLQTLASKLMGNNKGAVVAIDPKTGEILSMVSKPDFDPNSQKLAENWAAMVESKDAPFLPRATQGLYVPGSTFKTVISAMALENGLGDMKVEDAGSTIIDGKEFRNFGGEANGSIDLRKALTVSSNVFFSQLGVELGNKNLQELADRLWIEKDIPFDLKINTGSFSYKNMSKADMAAVGIGQGKILITPFNMALIAAGIANNGLVMKPTLVNRVARMDDVTVKQSKSNELYKIMKPETAKQLNSFMQEVVKSGTGRNAAINGINVAGKTGTAENELTGREKNREHAWFIGFAPAENPKIAVAVILEYSGSTGGQLAAPIARDLISNWMAHNK